MTDYSLHSRTKLLVLMLTAILMFFTSIMGTYSDDRILSPLDTDEQPSQNNDTNSAYESGVIFIKLKEDVGNTIRTRQRAGRSATDAISMTRSLDGLNRQFGVTQVSPVVPISAESRTKRSANISRINHIYVIRLTGDENNAVDAFNKDPNIDYAERAPIFKLATLPATQRLSFASLALSSNTNDPFYNPTQLWGLHNVGAEQAWQKSTGEGVVVAVLDTGVDITHPDLADNIWTNPGEIADNGIDDDGNGQIDDVHGWDFMFGAANPNGVGDNNPDDTNGHGTHVAGTIAAVGNNGIGVIGLAPDAKIMPVRVFGGINDGDNATTVEGFTRGITYAIDNGADVINNSWGGTNYSQAFKDLFDAAEDNNIIVVSAAGNNGDGRCKLYYPAAYNSSMSIGAVDENDDHSLYSNYNVTIDVAAPGGYGSRRLWTPEKDILSVASSTSSFNPNAPHGPQFFTGDNGEQYVTLAGTSMAAPHVSAVAALVRQQHPTWTAREVMHAIRQSSDDTGTIGFDHKYGYGRINAANAVNIQTAPPTASIENLFTEGFILPPPEQTAVNAHFDRDCRPQAGNVEVHGSTSHSYSIAIAHEDNPSDFETIFESPTPTDGILYVWDTTTVVDGWHTILLTTTDNSGNKSEDRTQVNINRIGISTDHENDFGFTGDVVRVYSRIPEKYADTLLSFYKIEIAEGLSPADADFTLIDEGSVFGFITSSIDASVTSELSGYATIRMTAQYGSVTAIREIDFFFKDELDQDGFSKHLTSDALPGNMIRGKSPQVADLDGDGSNEIIIGETVLEADAHETLLGEQVFHVRAGWPEESGGGQSNPAIIDTDGDGQLEVISSMTACLVYTSECAGLRNYGAPIVRAYNPDHSVDWEYVVQNPETLWFLNQGNISSISVGDVDGDGELEAVFTYVPAGNPVTYVIVLSAETGEEELRKKISEGFVTDFVNYAGVALADLDRDGDEEIIFGTSIVSEPNRGVVFALNGDGSDVDGMWPVYRIQDLAMTVPSVGDVGNDGDYEILAGNVLHHSDGDAVDNGFWILQSLPQSAIFTASSTLAELSDGDDELEIVMTGLPNEVYRVYEHDGTLKYIKSAPETYAREPYRGSYNDPTSQILLQGNATIGDIDGDGSVDIMRPHGLIQPGYYNLIAASGSTSAESPLNFPRYTRSRYVLPNLGTGAIADLDSDGDVEYITTTPYDTSSVRVTAWDLPTEYNADHTPWPMYQRDLRNSGTIPLKDTEITWTDWLNRDNPFGTGDYETARYFSPTVCGDLSAIVGVEARIVGQTDTFTPSDMPPQPLSTFSPTAGLVCRNNDQSDNCFDYEVRFQCSVEGQ